MKTYHFWMHDGYDGWAVDIQAISFEEAIQKAGPVIMPWWVSVTDGIEIRTFN